MSSDNDPRRLGTSRRLRIDHRGPGPGPDSEPEGGVSGRVVVTAAVLGVLVLWGGLYLAFRLWRSGYRDRAAFGLERVVRAIEPLAEVVPPGEGAVGEVSPAAWRRAVADSRAMLVTLTTSNLLDRPQMDALGADIDARVARARARPATACAELAGLWNDLQERAGFVIDHHPRPALLPPRPTGKAAAQPSTSSHQRR
jgi:hypothetical protein